MCGGYDGCGGRARAQTRKTRVKRKNQIRFAPCSAVSACAEVRLLWWQGTGERTVSVCVVSVCSGDTAVVSVREL